MPEPVMPRPVMQSPLHHLNLAAKARPVDGSAGVWANEIPLQGYVSLRGEAGNPAFVEAASGALGAALPTAPCTLVEAGDITVLWLSVDEWMITGPRERCAAVAEALQAALAGIRSQVVVNSGGSTEISITGRDAERALSHCTVYNLDKLAPGRVAGTTFGKSSVFLRREGQGFRLLVRRSFADYIWRFLERAAAPYGFGVAQLDTSALGAPGRAA
ncbi:MAG: sarcosine oxidase subunit gamma [Hyphomicrobium sp.]|uniref:sarcosine oxidase subunit gamma n=1 Tax=Hyphomicrobium sp. TaxID=82 RepID=UPI003D0D84DF